MRGDSQDGSCCVWAWPRDSFWTLLNSGGEDTQWGHIWRRLIWNKHIYLHTLIVLALFTSNLLYSSPAEMNLPSPGVAGFQSSPSLPCKLGFPTWYKALCLCGSLISSPLSSLQREAGLAGLPEPLCVQCPSSRLAEEGGSQCGGPPKSVNPADPPWCLSSTHKPDPGFLKPGFADLLGAGAGFLPALSYFS